MAELEQKLLSKKFYPAPGVKQLAWYLIPGIWGISVSEAETAEDISNYINTWRNVKPDIFKTIKIEPDLILF